MKPQLSATCKRHSEIVPFEKVVEEIKRMIGKENLDTYTPGEVVY